MNTKMYTIAALLAATLLTGIFSATPMAAFAGGDNYDDDNDNGNGDISETNTEQKLRQSNIGDSDSVNFNCGQNLINSPNIDQFCDNIETSDGTDGPVPPVVLTCEECLTDFVASLSVDDALAVTALIDAVVCDTLTADGITTLEIALTAVVSAEGDVSVAELVECLLASLV